MAVAADKGRAARKRKRHDEALRERAERAEAVKHRKRVRIAFREASDAVVQSMLPDQRVRRIERITRLPKVLVDIVKNYDSVKLMTNGRALRVSRHEAAAKDVPAGAGAADAKCETYGCTNAVASSSSLSYCNKCIFNEMADLGQDNVFSRLSRGETAIDLGQAELDSSDEDNTRDSENSGSSGDDDSDDDSDDD